MRNSASILLVDDDWHLVQSMAEWLRSLSHTVEVADGLASARNQLTENAFDLVITDLRLGQEDGFDLIGYCQEHHSDTTVLVMTGFATPATAVEAVRAGAFDLLTKPLIDAELNLAIERAVSQRDITRENEQLRQQLDQRSGLENVLSHDYRMLKIFDVMDSIADARASVLITGENGTGKSMIARAIHARSSRSNKAFVEVACGALPDNLLESELFGHVKGAFTGASQDRVGKFEAADGGTLFLDEIGTATPAMQVKLLRVLQEFQFEPLGGTKTRSVDTRVILATNEDLSRAVADGSFRQDLFYRINVVNIVLPSLRERAGDIPLLVNHFLRDAAETCGREIDGFDTAAISLMQSYAWPGNVRQLQNVVERAVLLSRDRRLTTEDLPPEITGAGNVSAGFSGSGVAPTSPADSAMGIPYGMTPAQMGPATSVAPTHNAASHNPAVHGQFPQLANPGAVTVGDIRGKSLKEALEGPERQIILQALRDHNWNRAATADTLEINRTTLYKKMKRLGLDDPRLQFAGELQ